MQQAPASGTGGPPAIQRMCPECEQERLQRQLPEDEEEEPLQAKREATGAPPAVSPRTEAGIAGFRGGGSPLPTAVRGYFEPRFGRSFEGVRVHTGPDAAAAAREVGARAFTVGSDVAFANGEWRPDTSDGRRLLAHELTHTVQQGTADRAPGLPAGRLQRQQGGAEEKEWYMLEPPEVRHQSGLTCWAGALSSWLKVRGMAERSVNDMVFDLSATSCIECDNSLPHAHVEEVFGEWGVVWENFSGVRPRSYSTFYTRLKDFGHLLLVEGTGLSHAVVVYGVGFDDQGRPNPGWFSIMDPINGTHRNRAFTSLGYPISLGHGGGARTAAACRSTPRSTPCEE
jgi:hypothetical protein